MYAEAAGARMTPVPYKGSAPLVTALIGGEVALGVDTVASAAPHAKAGRCALAVTGAHRSPQLPDVPTFAEASLPGVSMVGWYGLVAPAKTPAPVLDTLGRAVESCATRRCASPSRTWRWSWCSCLALPSAIRFPANSPPSAPSAARRHHAGLRQAAICPAAFWRTSSGEDAASASSGGRRRPGSGAAR